MYPQESKLEDIRTNFKQKIRSFEDQYLKQFEGLRLENSKLRSRLMEQASQIAKHHMEIEKLNSKGRSMLRSQLRTALVQSQNNPQLSPLPDQEQVNQLRSSNLDSSHHINVTKTSSGRERIRFSPVDGGQQEELTRPKPLKRPQTCNLPTV